MNGARKMQAVSHFRISDIPRPSRDSDTMFFLYTDIEKKRAMHGRRFSFPWRPSTRKLPRHRSQESGGLHTSFFHNILLSGIRSLCDREWKIHRILSPPEPARTVRRLETPFPPVSAFQSPAGTGYSSQANASSSFSSTASIACSTIAPHFSVSTFVIESTFLFCGRMTVFFSCSEVC